MCWWLVATVLIGATFVGVQLYEYTELVHKGFLPSSGLYGSTFYTMTGFHGFHVTVGVICMAWVTLKAFRGGYTQADHRGIEVVGLYWHFVDLVWIILFTIVYLI
jgi:cytochrome c oxidase subunit III